MSCRRISDSDKLFRQSIHPLSFKGRAFAWAKCLMLFSEPNGSLLEASLTWERYLPTTEAVHDYGCRLAFRMNEKKRVAGKLTDKNRNVYCGAYQLTGRMIRALASVHGLNEVLSAEVVHHVEEGEIAHASLQIILKPGGVTDVEGTKTAILDRLWNACSGPMRHVCDCDGNISEHPSESLAVAPGGEYFDTRSSLLRRWCIIRFHICSWLWRNFI